MNKEEALGGLGGGGEGEQKILLINLNIFFMKHSETLNQWSGENPSQSAAPLPHSKEQYIRVNVNTLNVYMYYNIARVLRKMCTHGHLCPRSFRKSDVLECHMRARFTALGIIRRVISYVQACRTYYIILYCILCRPCVRVQHSQTRQTKGKASKCLEGMLHCAYFNFLSI